MSSIASRTILRQSSLSLSPFIVLEMGQITIRTFMPLWSVWNWAPFWIGYMMMLGVFIYMSGGISQLSHWQDSA